MSIPSASIPSVASAEANPRWRHRVTQTTAALLENVEELATETGDSVEAVSIQLREMQATGDAMSRRVLAVAEAC